jgi:hypothetical protein
VKLGPKHYVIVAFHLSGMTPSTTYPLGLFSAPCGAAGARLLVAFPGADVNADGTETQTIYSRAAMENGIPAGSSLRLGAPGTDDSTRAASAVACANVPRAITAVDQPVTLKFA